jgi:hypothetical protein
VKLRRQASKYPTNNGAVLAERALERILEVAQGKAADEGPALDALVNDAESKGAPASQVVFARMFIAIVRSDATALAGLKDQALAIVAQGQRGLLAIEAMVRRRPGLALELLGSGPDLPLTGAGPIRYPQPVAIRALALMHRGRLKEALELEPRLAELAEHPCHLRAMAYIAYARGDLPKCLRMLDRAEQLFGGNGRTDIPLRAQALVEGALYDPLRDLLKAFLPNHPVTAHMVDWARRNPIPPGKLEQFLESDALLVSSLRTPTPRPDDCEHVIVGRRTDRWVPIILSASAWEPGFAYAAQFLQNSTPYLLRAVELPARTVQRLLGRTDD